MRKLTMFITGFAVMLVAGVATAQIGLWDAPSVDEFGSERPATALDVPDVDHSKEQAALEEAAAKAEKEAAEKQAVAKAEEEAAEKEAAEKEAAEKEAAEKEAAEKEVADTTPPEFEILHPTDGQVFEEKKVAFEGTAEPGARVFAGDYEADVDPDGNWRIVLWLNPGSNTATLHAKDAAGNKASASVKVFYEAPQESEKEVEFTAHQKFGETNKGYEKFYGTAKPGSKVTVTSNVGSAATEANEKGEYWVKLWYDAEPGTVFVATVSDQYGHSKSFEVEVLAPAEKEFTANQKYGSCSETPPYDKFYGTGTAGVVVEIFSEYGSNRTEIGPDGHWDMKVVFEGAPLGETFDVVLETSDGNRKVFSFTALEAGKEH